MPPPTSFAKRYNTVFGKSQELCDRSDEEIRLFLVMNRVNRGQFYWWNSEADRSWIPETLNPQDYVDQSKVARRKELKQLRARTQQTSATAANEPQHLELMLEEAIPEQELETDTMGSESIFDPAVQVDSLFPIETDLFYVDNDTQDVTLGAQLEPDRPPEPMTAVNFTFDAVATHTATASQRDAEATIEMPSAPSNWTPYTPMQYTSGTQDAATKRSPPNAIRPRGSSKRSFVGRTSLRAPRSTAPSVYGRAHAGQPLQLRHRLTPPRRQLAESSSRFRTRF